MALMLKKPLELRTKLAERGAEFHVIKNSSLRIVAKEKDIENISEYLTGHSAIVVGGMMPLALPRTLVLISRKKIKFRLNVVLLTTKSLQLMKLNN